MAVNQQADSRALACIVVAVEEQMPAEITSRTNRILKHFKHHAAQKINQQL
jgi:hypothetical protein